MKEEEDTNKHIKMNQTRLLKPEIPETLRIIETLELSKPYMALKINFVGSWEQYGKRYTEKGIRSLIKQNPYNCDFIFDSPEIESRILQRTSNLLFFLSQN